MRNVVKGPNILLKYVWLYFNIMHEKVNHLVTSLLLSNGWNASTIFAKSSILDFWLGSEYASVQPFNGQCPSLFLCEKDIDR